MYATMVLVFTVAAASSFPSGFPSRISQECMDEIQSKYAEHLTLSRHEARDHTAIMNRVLEQIDLSKCQNIHFRIDIDDTLNNEDVSNKPPQDQREDDDLKKESDDEFILKVKSQEKSQVYSNGNTRRNGRSEKDSGYAQQSYITANKTKRFDDESESDESDEEREYEDEKYIYEKYDDELKPYDKPINKEKEKKTTRRPNDNNRNVKRPYVRSKPKFNDDDYYTSRRPDDTSSESNDENYKPRQPNNKQKKIQVKSYTTRKPYDSDEFNSNEDSIENYESNEDTEKTVKTKVKKTYIPKNKFVRKDSYAETTTSSEVKLPVDYYERNNDKKRNKDVTKANVMETEVTTATAANDETKTSIDSITEKREHIDHFKRNKDLTNKATESHPHGKHTKLKPHDIKNSEWQIVDYTTTKILDSGTTTEIIFGATKDLSEDKSKSDTASTAQDLNNYKTKKTTVLTDELTKKDTYQDKTKETSVFTDELMKKDINQDKTKKTSVFNDKLTTKEVYQDKTKETSVFTDELTKKEVNQDKTKQTSDFTDEVTKKDVKHDKTKEISVFTDEVTKKDVKHDKTKETSVSTNELTKTDVNSDNHEDNKQTPTSNFVTETSKVTSTNNEFNTQSELKQDKIRDVVETESVDNIEKKDTVSHTSLTSLQNAGKSDIKSIGSEPNQGDECAETDVVSNQNNNNIQTTNQAVSMTPNSLLEAIFNVISEAIQTIIQILWSWYNASSPKI